MDTETAAVTASFVIWHCLILVFVLGMIGNVLNIYVFTRHKLRSSPCALYFLVAAIAGIYIVGVMIPSRILQNAYDTDPTYYSSAYCGIHYYLNNVAR